MYGLWRKVQSCLSWTVKKIIGIAAPTKGGYSEQEYCMLGRTGYRYTCLLSIDHELLVYYDNDETHRILNIRGLLNLDGQQHLLTSLISIPGYCLICTVFMNLILTI